MWISKRFYSPITSACEIGKITVSGRAGEQASASVQSKNIEIYSPYGYSFSAPKGEDVLLVSSALGTVGSGLKMKKSALAPGEVEISSLGGAKIILKNDGTVSINGHAFSKEGKGENSEK